MKYTYLLLTVNPSFKFVVSDALRAKNLRFTLLEGIVQRISVDVPTASVREFVTEFTNLEGVMRVTVGEEKFSRKKGFHRRKENDEN